MSHSSPLSRFVTSIINSQPKSGFVFVNIRIPNVSGSKRTRGGKNDVPNNNTLVDYCDSEECEVRGKEYEIMEPKETTHLLCGKSVYEAIRFGGSKEIERSTESMKNDFKHHTIDPVCMNVRLCMFWVLWAMLAVVLIVFILSYCCFVPKICRNSDKVVALNTTST